MAIVICPPERQHPPVFSFVTDGVESAIAPATTVGDDASVLQRLTRTDDKRT